MLRRIRDDVPDEAFGSAVFTRAAVPVAIVPTALRPVKVPAAAAVSSDHLACNGPLPLVPAKTPASSSNSDRQLQTFCRPSTTTEISSQSDALAARMLWEQQAKETVRLHMIADGFYTWCFTLSRWRCAESDAIAGAMHASRMKDELLRAVLGRWYDDSLRWRALQTWLGRTALAARATWQGEVARRCALERVVLRLRAAMSAWSAQARGATARRSALQPPLRRWAHAVAAHRYRLDAAAYFWRTSRARWREASLRGSVLAWRACVARVEAVDSAALRALIRSAERAMLRWRVWAGAQRRWKSWGDELARRRRPLHDGLVGLPTAPALLPHPQHRTWANGAAIRWDVASSGFAAELRETTGRAAKEYAELQAARRRHSRTLQMALGDAHRISDGVHSTHTYTSSHADGW